MPGILQGYATETLHIGALVKAFMDALMSRVRQDHAGARLRRASVYVLPGARMVRLFYNPLACYLAEALHEGTLVYPPHARLTHVHGIPSYLSTIRGDFRQGRNFLVAHSLGGYAALKQLHDTPGLVERVILIETPCEGGQLSPAIRWALKFLEGIDLETSDGPLAFLGRVKGSSALVRKISVIATRRPTFVPVEAYIVDGADVHLIDESTHTLLPHSPPVLATIATILRKGM